MVVAALDPVGSLTGTAALEAVADAFRGTGLEVSVTTLGAEQPLDRERALFCLRVMQEGLTNALRHGGAHRVDLVVDHADGLTLTLTDDGSAPETGDAEVATGYGLRSLTQQATRLGGDIDAGWSPDGFRLRAHLPKAVGMTRVLVVDDQQLLRRGLRMLLSTVDDIEVVGEAGYGEEALAVIPRLHPDVVVTDARMPRMDGPSLVAACRERHPLLPVLVLTTFDEPDVVRGSLGAGAAGFLLKDVSPERLAEGIWAAERGELVIDPRVARVALGGAAPSAGAEDPLALLTRTERAVADRVARGMANPEIAADLVVAEGTVKNHLTSLLRKLDQPNRTSLALLLHEAFVGSRS